MLDLRDGQAYICKRDNLEWWTLGKEYKIQTFSNGWKYLTDDTGDKWYLFDNKLLSQVFKLKEKTLDLNTLTTEQLREYTGLLEDKEDAERALTEFIERNGTR